MLFLPSKMYSFSSQTPQCQFGFELQNIFPWQESNLVSLDHEADTLRTELYVFDKRLSIKLTSVTGTGQSSSMTITKEQKDRDGLYANTCNPTFAIVLYKALYLNNRSSQYVCRHDQKRFPNGCGFMYLLLWNNYFTLFYRRIKSVTKLFIIFNQEIKWWEASM